MGLVSTEGHWEYRWEAWLNGKMEDEDSGYREDQIWEELASMIRYEALEYELEERSTYKVFRRWIAPPGPWEEVTE